MAKEAFASRLDKLLDADESKYLGIEKAFYHLGLKTPISRALAGGALAALVINFIHPDNMSDEDGRILWFDVYPGKIPAAAAVLAGAALFGIFL